MMCHYDLTFDFRIFDIFIHGLNQMLHLVLSFKYLRERVYFDERPSLRLKLLNAFMLIASWSWSWSWK